MFAAACGGGDDPTATSAPSGATPTTGASGTATAQPTQQVTDLPDPDAPQGTLVWAWTGVPQAAGVNQFGVSEIIMGWGVSELLFRQSDSNPTEPWLAKSYELASDSSKITFHLQEGVQFHGGWGELTAADIVWSLNNTNGAINPESIHGQAGDYAALFEEAVVVDDYSFEIPLKQFDVRIASYFLNQSGDGFGVFSKKAYDEEGEEWARDHIIATGPFQATEWVRDDRAVLTGVDQHWDKAPAVNEIRILHVPVGTNRLAMLLNGEADLAPLETKDLIEASKVGFVVAGTGRARHIPLVMAGNYWEKNHAVTGAPLDVSGAFAADLAWIGTPTDPADVEQAKKVRKAVAMAFDRATIAREFFNDIAKPLYMGSFFPSDPNWQSKWEVPYDPATAEALLDEAGYPKKADGTRFDMPIFGQSDNELFSEMAEVAAGELRKIGINTSVLHYAYASFRPTMVQRSNTIPVTMTCRQNNGGAPWDWPRLEEYSSITRGGFGCGIEDPHVAEVYQQVAVETDVATRIQTNNDLADYWFDQMFEPGIVSVPEAVAYNPKSISAWDMRPGIFLVVNSPENIVLAR
jgi:ABC-type transport system substrate-binding protein